MKKIIFSESEEAEIVNLYITQQLSTREIGKRFGVSKETINRVLKANNVNCNHTARKIQGNYHIFHTIDSKEKAYWLGFLAADGCNYQRKYNASVILSLSQKDLQHLKLFKEFMQTDASIQLFEQNCGFSKNSKMCKLVLNSKELSNDLSDKGIVPKKSLILNIPKIPEEYYLSFILGYFDGDGTIFKTKTKEFGIAFVGTKELLTWIKAILGLSCSLEQRAGCEKNNYYIRCGGIKKPYFIMKQLYDNCPVHLDRKYQMYKALETVVFNSDIKNYQV